MADVNAEKVAEIRRAYQKKWRARNKDRVREYNRRFWERQAEKQSGNTEQPINTNAK